MHIKYSLFQQELVL